MHEFLARDLEYILNYTRSIWKGARGGRIFITGGTGSTGIWLLESFMRANDALKLKAQAVVLTRDVQAFRQKAPQLGNHPAIQLCQGDIRNFVFPAGRFTHIIHAAAERDPRLYIDHPMRMLDTALSGTRRVLDFALQSGNPKVLLVSSGAVYGSQTSGLAPISEEHPSEPDVSDPCSVFGEGKRLSEVLVLTYGRHYGLRIKIGRCFSFIGPGLPLEFGGVVGRFIRDGLQGGPIHVNGDGEAYRSYLYAADLAIWLWTILVEGECGRAYNVGSEQAVTIADLADQVGKAFRPPVEVIPTRIAQRGERGGNGYHPDKEVTPHQEICATDCLIPSTQAARAGLHLEQHIDLAEAIHRTVDWYLQEFKTAHV